MIRLENNVVKRKEAELKTQEYMRELEQANQDLDDFALIVAHDLKEPIRGISNNVLMLKEDHGSYLKSSAIRRIDRISFLCIRMEKLVNDVLHFARIKHGSKKLKKVDLNNVLKEICTTLENMAEEINAEILIPRELPKILCDGVTVGELFRNLITNGIKYNNKTKKIIEIGYKEEIIDKKLQIPQYVFYVKDNGIGIDSSHHKDIFRLFKRLDEDPSQDLKSTGVGLTFVKKIIERHGGKIWLESYPRRGTTFYFTLS